MRARSLLFVPGLRPERFAKAVGCAPDIVCLDLEDSVGARDKDAARSTVLAGLPALTAPASSSSSPEIVVRINSPRHPAGLRDLLGLVESAVPPHGVLLPKASSAAELRWVAELLSHAARPVALHALIEGAAAVSRAGELAAAGVRLRSVLLGGVDLATDLGLGKPRGAAAPAPLATGPLDYARARLVNAVAAAAAEGSGGWGGGGGLAVAGAAAAGWQRPAILDSPRLSLAGAGAGDAAAEADALRAECEHARRMGCTGKAAIHPAQLPVIHEVFTPTPEELGEARAVLRAFAAAGGGASVLEGGGGTIVELPVVLHAIAVLGRAGEDAELPPGLLP
jgi:(S)-citramalyl-CoA lyase